MRKDRLETLDSYFRTSPTKEEYVIKGDAQNWYQLYDGLCLPNTCAKINLLALLSYHFKSTLYMKTAIKIHHSISKPNEICEKIGDALEAFSDVYDFGFYRDGYEVNLWKIGTPHFRAKLSCGYLFMHELEIELERLWEIFRDETRTSEWRTNGRKEWLKEYGRFERAWKQNEKQRKESERKNQQLLKSFRAR